MREPSQAAGAIDGAEVLLNAGPAGVHARAARRMGREVQGRRRSQRRSAARHRGRRGERRWRHREGAIAFGALGIGNFKMKVHKECIARLFSRNDLVLDAETIEDVAKEIMTK